MLPRRATGHNVLYFRHLRRVAHRGSTKCVAIVNLGVIGQVVWQGVCMMWVVAGVTYEERGSPGGCREAGTAGL